MQLTKKWKNNTKNPHTPFTQFLLHNYNTIIKTRKLTLIKCYLLNLQILFYLYQLFNCCSFSVPRDNPRPPFQLVILFLVYSTVVRVYRSLFVFKDSDILKWPGQLCSRMSLRLRLIDAFFWLNSSWTFFTGIS